MKITERIYDVNTGETVDIEREATADEIKAAKLAQEEAAAVEAERVEIQAARKVILDKLGITLEEAKLLLS